MYTLMVCLESHIGPDSYDLEIGYLFAIVTTEQFRLPRKSESP